MTDQNDLVEVMARAICQSGRFETGQGTCAAICMDQLGSARQDGCAHAVRVHSDFCNEQIDALHAAGYRNVNINDGAMIEAAQAAYERGEKWSGIVQAMLDSSDVALAKSDASSPVETTKE